MIYRFQTRWFSMAMSNYQRLYQEKLDIIKIASWLFHQQPDRLNNQPDLRTYLQKERANRIQHFFDWVWWMLMGDVSWYIHGFHFCYKPKNIPASSLRKSKLVIRPTITGHEQKPYLPYPIYDRAYNPLSNYQVDLESRSSLFSRESPFKNPWLWVKTRVS